MDIVTTQNYTHAKLTSTSIPTFTQNTKLSPPTKPEADGQMARQSLQPTQYLIDQYQSFPASLDDISQ